MCNIDSTPELLRGLHVNENFASKVLLDARGEDLEANAGEFGVVAWLRWSIQHQKSYKVMVDRKRRLMMANDAQQAASSWAATNNSWQQLELFVVQSFSHLVVVTPASVPPICGCLETGVYACQFNWRAPLGVGSGFWSNLVSSSNLHSGYIFSFSGFKSVLLASQKVGYRSKMVWWTCPQLRVLCVCGMFIRGLGS